jgi:hypothetical protein
MNAEDLALEALVALALRQDTMTDEEIAEYLNNPVILSEEDAAALERKRPEFLKALREELRPDSKQFFQTKKQQQKKTYEYTQ